MNPPTLHIVHPSLDTSTRMRRWLYIVAGFLLLLFSFQFYNDTHVLGSGIYGILCLVALCFVAAAFHVQNLFRHPLVNFIIRSICAMAFFLIAWHFYQKGNTLFAVMFLLSALAYLMLGLTEKYILADILIAPTEKELLVPGSFGDVAMPWSKIKDVIHKDGWLTILLQNNRYLQFELTAENTEVEINAFIAYCKQWLNA